MSKIDGRAKKGSKISEQNFTYVFQKNQVVALKQKGLKDDEVQVKFFIINEDVKTNDQDSRVKAIELQKSEKKSYKTQGQAIFNLKDEKLIPVKGSMKPIENFQRRKTHKRNPQEQFVFDDQKIQEITKELQEIEISDKQPKKIVFTKNTEKSKPKDTDQDDSMEEKDDEEQVNVEPKQAVKKRGRPSKKLAFTSESEAESKLNKKYNQRKETEEQEQINTQSRTLVTMSTQTEENEVKKKITQRGKKPSSKFMKGKYNPKIENIIEINVQLDGISNEMKFQSAIRINNKELIRAARIGNQKLFDAILQSEYKISSLFERWAPERDFNAIEVIFQQNNKKLLIEFLKFYKNKHKLKLAAVPECSIKEIDTGFNDKYAYGVRTRKVALSRGSREGNNALVQDISQEQEWSEYMMDRLLETDTDPYLFSLLRADLNQHIFMILEQRIPVAVRAGNYKVAGALISMVVKKGAMYGYNNVHAQVLQLTDSNQLGTIKRPSAIKKITGLMQVTPIHCAAINPNPQFLNVLLDISGEFTITDELLRKPVHYAAVCTSSGPLELLLKRGVDAREGDRDKTTPLMLACKYGRIHNVKVLLANIQCDINQKNKEGQAAVHYAAAGGHIECLQELIKQNDTVLNIPGKNKMTPLIQASAYGHLKTVKYLLDQGAKILSKDKFKRSALLMAVRNGNIEVASLLLMRGAEFNGFDSSKNSCVHYAAAYGFSHCVDLLIKAGADQNAKNQWNLTPLSVALQKNLFGIVKSLLNYESTDVNCKDDEGRTLVSSSLSKFNADTLEYIQFLVIDKKADVTIEDLNGKTPLHYAVQITPLSVKNFYPNWNTTMKSEKQDIIESYTQLIFNLLKLLFDHGADINKQDNQGITPLMEALQHKNYVIAEKLISLQKPDINLTNKHDENILHIMARGGVFMDSVGYEIYRNLLENINNRQEKLAAIEENGGTPLLLVVEHFTKNAKSYYNHQLEKFTNDAYESKFEVVLKEEEKKPKNKSKQKKSVSKKKTQIRDEEDYEQIEDYESEEKMHDDISINTDEDEEINQSQRKKLGKFSRYQPQQGQFKQQIYFNQTQLQSQQLQLPTFGNLNQFDSNKTFVHSRTFYLGNQPKVIQLNQQEYDEIIELCQKSQRELEQRFMNLINILIINGADPLAQFVRVKKYRSNKNMTQFIDEDESKLNSNLKSGLRGGARTKQIARIIQGEPMKQQQLILSTDIRYCEWGKCSAIHMIFANYPNVSILKYILEQAKFDINQQDHLGRTPFMCFTQKCNEGSFIVEQDPQELITEYFFDYVINKLKVNVFLADRQRNTPISILATRGLFNMCEQLINLGASLNNTNKSNVVPLSYWVNQKEINNVKRLLELGADPNYQDKDKRTALHHAVNSSQSTADASFEMEQLLIRHKAKADVVDKNGRTPLFYAFIKIGLPFEKSEIDPFETVSSLCALPDCQVNIRDKWKKSPLHYAAQRGSVISGRYLIKLQCEVDSFDVDQNTPLAIAFMNGHSNFATMLIDNKASVSEIATKVDLNKLVEQAKQRKSDYEKQKKEISLEIDSDIEEPEYEPDYDDEIVGFDNISINPFNQQVFQKQPRYFQNASPQVNLQPGQYSFFMLAIKNGWQGLAYLLISDGFDIQRAIEDAIRADQFKLVKTLLMKVKDNQILRKSNKEGHNLFHIFAMRGGSCNQAQAQAIIDELFYRGVSENALDNRRRSPLHYASEHNFQIMTKILLERNCDPNLLDNQNNTPFSLGIQSNFIQFFTTDNLNTWMKAKTNLNQPFNFNGKMTTLIIYLIEEKNLIQEEIYQNLIDNGVDINIKDQNTQGVIVHSIKINSIFLVNFFLQQPSLNKKGHYKDSKGRSPIHHVVQPLEFGSYENLELLKQLSKYFDINEPDNDGKYPIDFAVEQDSGLMKTELMKLGSVEPKYDQRSIKTSPLSEVKWPEEVDYEEDAQQYLASKEKDAVHSEDEDDDKVNQVDQHAKQGGGQLTVLSDKELGPYSLIMTKVDVKNGFHSENVFYRMQVLYERNRNVYILFTRWGRIGTPGQFQMTPFEDQEQAVKEYNKIFLQKSGNDWRKIQTQEEQFCKQRGKYQLMNITQKQNYKQFLEPFDYSDRSPYPQTTLHDEIRDIMIQFTQVKLYIKQIDQFQIDTEFLPLERLTKAQLVKAREYLNEIQELIQELKELFKEGKQQFEIEDLEEIQRIKDELCERSSRFYELIPNKQYRDQAVPVIDNETLLNQNFNVIETLLQFEVTSKILLGAHLRKMQISPLTYCFNSLNIKIIKLQEISPEFYLIKQFIQRSKQINPGFIVNIFAIQRKHEVERFEPWKKFGNRALLWHGSKVSNYMGILSQGLKVAPPWAYSTGSMFGKGIYFADTFEKSYAYTQDWQLNLNWYNGTYTRGGQTITYDKEMKDIQKYKYMLLCEVALGKSKELRQAEDIHTLPTNIQSVKGLGRKGPNPDQSIVLSNGCKVPIGQIIDYPQSKDPKLQLDLNHNEFIVYNEAQVCIRYMIQLDGTKD